MTVDQIPIGRFSVATRLTQKALRYYDGKGLLVPEAKDPITGYRYYNGGQIQRGVKIKHLSTLGFSVEEIAAYLEAEAAGDKNKLGSLVEARLRDTEEELIRLRRVASLLDNNHITEMMKKTMSEPEVKDVPGARVISKWMKGSYVEAIGKLIGDLMAVLYSPENQASFVKMVGPIMTFYHDEDYKETDADVEVAVPVTGKVTIEDPGVEVRNLPPRRVASLVHKGSYESIGLAYAKLHEYMAANGLEAAGPMTDVYLNDPNTVEPDEVLTEIQAPIKP
ncbi:MerR family transcriptional regulator [Candidatus Bathyarchaeota archaeon]|nr:MerR family transcriptional regulator [Candidatus Bathyarchaeota archaeon]